MIRWFSEFELGFDHPDADVNNFDPKIECENRKGNSVPLGSKCFIKCKPVSQKHKFFQKKIWYYFAIFYWFIIILRALFLLILMVTPLRRPALIVGIMTWSSEFFLQTGKTTWYFEKIVIIKFSTANFIFNNLTINYFQGQIRWLRWRLRLSMRKLSSVHSRIIYNFARQWICCEKLKNSES